MQCAPPTGATIQAAFLDVVEYDGSDANPPPCTTSVDLGGAATPAGVMTGSGNLWNIFVDPRYGDPIAPADYPNQTAFNIRYDYFAHTGSPWERGTCENTNGLIRQFFPKGTDFNLVPLKQIRWVEKLLNERPRKILGFRTPKEVLAEQLR
jgi:hypothetical protein